MKLFFSIFLGFLFCVSFSSDLALASSPPKSPPMFPNPNSKRRVSIPSPLSAFSTPKSRSPQHAPEPGEIPESSLSLSKDKDNDKIIQKLSTIPAGDTLNVNPDPNTESAALASYDFIMGLIATNSFRLDVKIIQDPPLVFRVQITNPVDAVAPLNQQKLLEELSRLQITLDPPKAAAPKSDDLE